MHLNIHSYPSLRRGLKFESNYHIYIVEPVQSILNDKRTYKICFIFNIILKLDPFSSKSL